MSSLYNTSALGGAKYKNSCIKRKIQNSVYICALLTFFSTNWCGIICDIPPAPLETIGDVIELLDADFSDFVL